MNGITDIISLLWVGSPIIVVVLIIALVVQSRNNAKAQDKLRKDYYDLNFTKNVKIAEIDKLLKEAHDETRYFKRKNEALNKKIEKRNETFRKIFERKKDSFPYVAGLAADYLTYDLEVLHKGLNWGSDQRRLHKAEDIRILRKNSKQQIEMLKEAEYKLRYVMSIHPEISELFELDSNNLAEEKVNEANNVSDEDRIRGYLSSEEWMNSSEEERNQLALDRYIASHRKTNWQIGRDYELYVGWLYENKGWKVEYTGSTMRLNDMGRDLIAKKNGKTEIIQCKYWSNNKLIHEKHIFQLYGSTILYRIQNETENVCPRFVTNIKLSTTAQEVAKYLGVEVEELHELKEFPRVKCNIGKDEYGHITQIYHLPMDQQYDNVVINPRKGEFMALTVAEAVNAGFRRAYKWHGEA